MTKSWHAIARGRVQGVGFRYMASELAKKHSITGTVQNLKDGTVEIFVQGSQENVDSFFSDLSKHFHLKEPLAPIGQELPIEFSSFEIKG